MNSKKKKTPRLQQPVANPYGKTDYFFNRELSWLKFNERVLSEALDKRNPLFERIRFSEIFISNLDEFYMKRVGRLKSQIESGKGSLSIDGKTPSEQLHMIKGMVDKQLNKLADNFQNTLLPELEQEGVQLLKWKDLSKKEKEKLRQYYLESIYPILTPLAVDSGHPFPFISNLSKSLGVSLVRPGHEKLYFSRVKIPKELPQWVLVEHKSPQTYRFISMDDLIKENIDNLFPGMEIKDINIFRMSRSAEWEADEEDVDDILEMVEEGVKIRKFNPIVRMEHEANPDPWIISFIQGELGLPKDDIYEFKSLINYSRFSEILNTDMPHLKFRQWRPRIPRELDDDTHLFQYLQKKDLLVYHPYESFSASVEKFIKDAAKDNQVMAIKMTLYRTGDNSQIVESLILAAESGKQVVCLIELKARFEEERNIYWAQKLVDAGVHVVYGFAALKTHSKMILVVRKDHDGIKSYCHIGTGNYNAQTSKLYTDYSFLTSDSDITNEVIEVFNYLTGRSLKNDYQKLLVAPVNLKNEFLRLIKEEAKHAQKGKPGLIMAKMNQLEDIDIIQALYDASQKGVMVFLFIRGFCCLRPQVPGLSENIFVTSIVGRFLEHTRLFYFGCGHKNPVQGKFFLGSADWMHRNLHNRVEVITPIDDIDLKKELWEHLQIFLNDDRMAWDLKPDGNYVQRKPKYPEKHHGSQYRFMKRYKK